MTYDETEIVADAALQLGTLRDCLARPADLGDGQLRLIEQGISKVIGLLGALPIDSEPTLAVCPKCNGWGMVRPEIVTKAFGELVECDRCGGAGAYRESEGEAA